MCLRLITETDARSVGELLVFLGARARPPVSATPGGEVKRPALHDAQAVYCFDNDNRHAVGGQTLIFLYLIPLLSDLHLKFRPYPGVCRIGFFLPKCLRNITGCTNSVLGGP